VIPTFNAARYVGQAIESACSQTRADIEILVVDDASTDDTVAVVERYAAIDPRIRLWRLESNRGPSHARNFAIGKARGTWIALLDSDDVYLPSRLDVLLRVAEEKNADLVADNQLLRRFEDGRPLGVAYPDHQFVCDSPISTADFVGNDMPDGRHRPFGFLKPIMRREFLLAHKLRYAENLWIGEDFLLYVMCLAAGARFFLTPESFYVYSQRMGSIVHTRNQSDNSRQLLEGNRRLAFMLKDMKDAELSRLLAKRGSVIAAGEYYWMFREALREGLWVSSCLSLLRFAATRHAPVRVYFAARRHILDRLPVRPSQLPKEVGGQSATAWQ